MRVPAVLAALAALLARPFESCGELPRYLVAPLGPIDGTVGIGLKVNNIRQVVGEHWHGWNGGWTRGFFFDEGIGIRVGHLGGDVSTCTGINDLGVVVGYGETLEDDVFHAFTYANGVFTDLGNAPGATATMAQSINDDGQLTGWCVYPGEFNRRGFVYSNGVFADIGPIRPGGSSYARSINNNGAVVGNGNWSDNHIKAFVYHDGIMDILPDGGFGYSNAFQIRDDGVIVGETYDMDGDIHAAVWVNGVLRDLGVPGGWKWSRGYGINNRDEIVGVLCSDAEWSRAMLYMDRRFFDLNDLIPPDSGWILEQAHSINDDGTICGFGSLNGQQQAFVARPVRLTIDVEKAGDTVTVSWRNAPAASSLTILYATRNGTAPAPATCPCAGVQLGLAEDGLRVATVVPSGRNGNGHVQRRTFAQTGRIQVIVQETCEMSNVDEF